MYLANDSLQMLSDVVVKLETVITSVTVQLTEVGLDPNEIVMRGPSLVIIGFVITQVTKLFDHRTGGAIQQIVRARINQRSNNSSMEVNKMFRIFLEFRLF